MRKVEKLEGGCCLLIMMRSFRRWTIYRRKHFSGDGGSGRKSAVKSMRVFSSLWIGIFLFVSVMPAPDSSVCLAFWQLSVFIRRKKRRLRSKILVREKYIACGAAATVET